MAPMMPSRTVLHYLFDRHQAERDLDSLETGRMAPEPVVVQMAACMARDGSTTVQYDYTGLASALEDVSRTVCPYSESVFASMPLWRRDRVLAWWPVIVSCNRCENILACRGRQCIADMVDDSGEWWMCSGDLEQKERMKAREERENNKTRESSNFGLDLR